MKDIPVKKSSNHACTEQNSLINGPTSMLALHSELTWGGGGGERCK